MPFSSGVFSLFSTGNPVVTGTTISSTWCNSTLSDIATGLSSCVLKDGTQTITSNIPMSSFKFTGLGAGTAAGNSLRYEQLFTTTTLTDQATITWDASLAPVATVTLTASRTMAAPTNLKAGGLYGLVVTQNGTGGWTLTWNAVFRGWGGNTMPQPETTASRTTAFVFYSPDGTNLDCLQCAPFVDTNYIVRGSSDATKKLRFEVDGNTTATTRTLTPMDDDYTIGDRITLGTPATTTSGTTVDFSGVVSGARRVTINFNGVSTSGTSPLIIQIGPTGGVENTGYLGTVVRITSAGAAAATSSTAGYSLTSATIAAGVYSGSINLYLMNSSNNTWATEGTLGDSTTPEAWPMAGRKSISGVLDKIRITTTGGADTFDAGEINIQYER